MPEKRVPYVCAMNLIEINALLHVHIKIYYYQCQLRERIKKRCNITCLSDSLSVAIPRSGKLRQHGAQVKKPQFRVHYFFPKLVVIFNSLNH